MIYNYLLKHINFNNMKNENFILLLEKLKQTKHNTQKIIKYKKDYIFNIN
jgi:hypothetical protein